MTEDGRSQLRRASSSSGATSAVSPHSTMEDRRASHSTASSDGPLPQAPGSGHPERGSRKRAASSDIHESGRLRLSDLGLETPSSGPLGPDSRGEFICLCTSAPKVPRPRNAFILYRQHHQAQVVADNPGLANPEVSKIIGTQWKNQPEDVKQSWKRLAEEEKLRHQQQYPDYRYQPRRGQKSGGRPGSASSEDPGHCPKCGGRFIAIPRTPSTPLMTPTPARSNMQQCMPRERQAHEGQHVRHVLPQGRQQPFPSHSRLPGHFRDDEHYETMSPSSDPKRRRYNASGHYQSMPPPSPYPHQNGAQTRQSSLSGPASAASDAGFRPAPLPGPSILARQGTASMAPPPRPGHAPYPGAPRSAGFDESLRLPPLQTQMPPNTPWREPDHDIPSAQPAETGIAGSRDGYASNVEAMVMTIPFLNKVKVLSRISPPLAATGPMSPSFETRGAMIAVEGPNAKFLEKVGAVMHRALLGTGDVDLKTWSDMQASTPSKSIDDDAVRGSGSNSASSSRKGSLDTVLLTDMYVDYMQKMVQWHDKSRQIVKHITTRPSFGSDAPHLGSRAAAPEAETANTKLDPASATRLPVALVTSGFSLTISDRYACRIPIADSYAPVDHWQWMATLWRGIVGPDLVVYVKPSTEEEASRAGAISFVENGIMLVRVVPEKGVDEKTERRICFEVVEWLRGGSYKEGLGRG